MKTESGPLKYRLGRLTSKSYGSVETKYILQGWFAIDEIKDGFREHYGEWRDLETVDITE